MKLSIFTFLFLIQIFNFYVEFSSQMKDFLGSYDATYDASFSKSRRKEKRVLGPLEKGKTPVSSSSDSERSEGGEYPVVGKLFPKKSPLVTPRKKPPETSLPSSPEDPLGLSEIPLEVLDRFYRHHKMNEKLAYQLYELSERRNHRRSPSSQRSGSPNSQGFPTESEYSYDSLSHSPIYYDSEDYHSLYHPSVSSEFGSSEEGSSGLDEESPTMSPRMSERMTSMKSIPESSKRSERNYSREHPARESPKKSPKQEQHSEKRSKKD